MPCWRRPMQPLPWRGGRCSRGVSCRASMLAITAHALYIHRNRVRHLISLNFRGYDWTLTPPLLLARCRAIYLHASDQVDRWTSRVRWGTDVHYLCYLNIYACCVQLFLQDSALPIRTAHRWPVPDPIKRVQRFRRNIPRNCDD